MKEHIEALGYTVVDINNAGYQFRVNGVIDVYPKSKKFFNLHTKEWGVYDNVPDLLHEHIGMKDYIGGDTDTESHVDEEKARRVEQVIQNIERRLDSKKIVSRPRQIMAEEIIKLL